MSTDYDTSDMLFFEPLTVEDVLNICDRVQPDGVIVQFGGQTPLNLARRLADAGVPIIGTSVDAIEAAEDREKFQQLLAQAGPASSRPTASPARWTRPAARRRRSAIRCFVRPSFVLGGRAMEICYDTAQLERFVAEAFIAAEGQPVLIDRFLEGATEVDVDCISDGTRRDRARHHGAHRGGRRPLGRLGVRDSAVQLAGAGDRGDSRGDGGAGAGAERRRADERAVRGAVGRRRLPLEQGELSRPAGASPPPVVYVLEVNPRASRTVPFVAKATGLPVAKIAAKVMAGVSLAEQGVTERSGAVARFGEGSRVPVHQVLGRRHRARPRDALDRRSDGHERAILDGVRQEPARGRHGAAASGQHLHQRRRPAQTGGGRACRASSSSWASRCSRPAARPTRSKRPAFPCRRVKKLQEGQPNLLDYFADRAVALVVNTPSGKGARTDEGKIRAAAVQAGVPCVTTLEAATAAVKAIEALREEEMQVQALQDRFASER